MACTTLGWVRGGRVFTAKSEEWVRLTFEKQRGISEAAEFPEIRI